MLHPQTRALLDLMEQAGRPPLHMLSPIAARAAVGEMRDALQPAPPAVGQVRDLSAMGPLGRIPVRLYRPFRSDPAALLPILVYFHGGGWVIGDLESHDGLCRELANWAECAVLAVDYRMGPEHRFPAAVTDCVAATRWVHDHADELRVDAARVAVGGDSAGGNLAAVVAIAARDSADMPIVFQLLIYPATDQHCATASHVEHAEGYFLTRETMEYFIGHYIDDRAAYDDWRASPLLHPDLSRLPPALVLTAGFDPLRDEGAAYAQRLTDAGTRASYVCFSRQIHGFMLMAKVIDEAHTAIALCAVELRRAFAAA
jgi:acetyl esterase